MMTLLGLMLVWIGYWGSELIRLVCDQRLAVGCVIGQRGDIGAGSVVARNENHAIE